MARTNQTTASHSRSGKKKLLEESFSASSGSESENESVKKVSKKLKAAQGEKRVRRFRPGTVAVRQIRAEQGDVSLVGAVAPFSAYVKTVLKSLNEKDDSKPIVRVSKNAIRLLRTVAQDCTVAVFAGSRALADHAHRTTVCVADMAKLEEVRGQFFEDEALFEYGVDLTEAAYTMTA